MIQWARTGDHYLHNHVYYIFWKRQDKNGEYIYNVTIDATTPPGPFWGGYASPEALIKTKFGT